MVISDTIEKKMNAFQTPNLNEIMDEVCQTLGHISAGNFLMTQDHLPGADPEPETLIPGEL